MSTHKNNESRPATFEDLKKLIMALNAENADYILIGGYALFTHGFFRTTTDIDLLVPSDKDAGKKIVKALLILQDKAAQDIDLIWFEKKENIRVADEIVVDIMFNAAGQSYDALKKYIEIIEIEGIPIKTMNIEGLLLTKQTPRERDIADKLFLEKILSELKRKKNNLRTQL